MCFLAQLRRSGSKGVGIDKGEPPKWGGGRLGSAVLGRGMADPLKTSPSPCVLLAELGGSVSKGAGIK